MGSTALAAMIVIALPAPVSAEDAVDSGTNSEITVSGTRLAKTARQEEEAATNLVNIQSAETIAKYPDVNAAEALSRVPGVFVDTDTGEGRFINIRGIDGNLNGATFGGAVLLNTNPGATQFNGTGRAVLFNTLPIGAIDRIEVIKSGLPDHEAEGLGGSIELTPRSALTHPGFFIDGKLGGGYENERNTGLIDEEFAIGDSFGRNRDGDRLVHFVLAQSLRDDKRGFDDIEAGYADSPGILGNVSPEDKIYNSLEYRRYNYQRKRYGYSFDLDITPDSNNLLFLRGSLAGYTERTVRQRLVFNNLDGTGSEDAAGNPIAGSVSVDPNNPNGFVATGASADNTLRYIHETDRNLVLQTGGRHHLGAFKIDWMASYVRAFMNNPYDYNATFTGPRGLTVAYDNTTNPAFPKATATGVDLADPSLYNLHDIQNSAEYSADREYSYHLNVAVPLHLFQNDELKFGGELRYRHKYDMTNSASLSFADPTTDFGTGPSLTSLLGPGPFTHYYQGLANIGYSANPYAIASAYGAQLAIPPLRRNDPNALVFDDIEDVTAGYIQYSADIGKLHVLAGVRVEHTKQILGGFTATSTVDPATNDTITTTAYSAPRKSYTNVFPAVHLVYRPFNHFDIKASYSTSIARPGFYQTAAQQTVDVGNAIINRGNPDLKPTYSNNFDLYASYYLPNAGVLSVGIFYKDIKDFVVARSIVQPQTIAGNTDNYRIFTYSNVSGTYDRGVEADYVQKFSRLPAPFNGFGVDMNLVYNDTKVSLTDGQPSQPMPGTADFSANAALFYEAHGVSLRLAMNHNSKTLYSIGSGPTVFSYGSIPTDVFLAARTTLDLSGSYDIWKNISVYGSVKNLTDAPLYTYEGTPNRPYRREFYGQTFEAGVKFNF